MNELVDFSFVYDELKDKYCFDNGRNAIDPTLISRLSKTVTHGPSRKAANFEYNKDADMYVCKAGHMSIKKTSTRPKKHAKDGQGTVK